MASQPTDMEPVSPKGSPPSRSDQSAKETGRIVPTAPTTTQQPQLGWARNNHGHNDAQAGLVIDSVHQIANYNFQSRFPGDGSK
jgi:hypothetical protein